MFYSSRFLEKKNEYAAIRNNHKKHQIRSISEGWCDTEDWSNGCWKIKLYHHMNKLHNTISQTETSSFDNFSQYYCFYCILIK